MKEPRYRQEKLRGIPRRMRALRRWASGFSGNFPRAQELTEGSRHWNWKIPVDCRLVEGKHTTPQLQRECAQLLIDACSLLISAKPDWARTHRATCLVAFPDMFTSEVCIYLDEAYYQSKVQPSSSEYGHQEPIIGRSLATEWGLVLPENVRETGVMWRYDASPEHYSYVSEHWMYGEVA